MQQSAESNSKIAAKPTCRQALLYRLEKAVLCGVMPELPEVETIRQGLQRRVVGKRITAVDVRKKKMVRGSVPAFLRAVRGQKITSVGRRGKLLILHLSDNQHYVLLHLKMTGQLIYKSKKVMVAGGHQWPPVGNDLPNKYSHVIFSFADNSQLFFNDLRQFGYLALVNERKLQTILSRYGVDPLEDEFTWEQFRQALDKRKGRLKAVLLDQRVITGIGNIYADEICFHARLLPTRSLSSLSGKEKGALYQAIKHVLARAMRYGGTTFRNYRDTEGGKGNFTQLLKVYKRAGQLCKRCKEHVIMRAVIAGRGTHFCPHCQN